jgi:hypothetical protein
LENHANPAPQIDDVQTRFVNVDAVDPDCAARDPSAIDEIVHPVQTTQ